jgi:hypothetical protein
MDYFGCGTSVNTAFLMSCRKRTDLKHLGCDNDGLAHNVALRNHHLLRQEYLTGRNFNSQITARDHHTIGLLENFVKVSNTLLVLNLDNDLNAGAVWPEHGADVLHILGTADKGSEDHVDAVPYTELQIRLVLVRESGKVDVGLGKIDTLARGDVSVVQSAYSDIGSVDGKHQQGENTIIDIDELSRRGHLGKVDLQKRVKHVL